jgi:hypothetical protein
VFFIFSIFLLIVEAKNKQIISILNDQIAYEKENNERLLCHNEELLELSKIISKENHPDNVENEEENEVDIYKDMPPLICPLCDKENCVCERTTTVE